MPFYQAIDTATEAGKRTAQCLLELRRALDAQVPGRTLEETLLLATWNIREFGAGKYGGRLPESIQYIAEIIARFDLVAVQEVRRNLAALNRVRTVLGPYWKCVFTDTGEGGRANNERMAFLFDSRKVRFGGLAGELVIPPLEQGGRTVGPSEQFWRTPFVVGFNCGWSSFCLCTAHILWGKGSGDSPPERVAEIKHLAQFMRTRALDPDSWSQNIVLLGDFNIAGDDDETFKQLTDAGFTVPPEVRAHPSNAPKTKHYDQIAFFESDQRLETTGQAGAFDFFQTVFRDPADEALYAQDMGAGYVTDSKGKVRDAKSKSGYWKKWRTFQMSDHLPLWVELRIDYSDEYLERKLANG
ncbi:MAG: endonuclease/exonuclease/phosphatase family protein [Proteobacteria bacterium]|nr:endonuclease/exonuclease/phosphatase family protein [Pseudomonadota bacterium]